MKLTIVGCSGSFPGPDSPSSCYLVEADGYRVLLDLGNGALGYVARHIDIDDVDAVLLSHLHVDHCIDLCSMYVARTYHPDGPRPKLPVYGPEGTAARLAAAYGSDAPDGLGCAYDFVEWRQGTVYDLGPFRVEVAQVVHTIEAYAMRIAYGERVLVYSGDTGNSDALVEVARAADLFLCEAAFTPDETKTKAAGVHLNGREAGEHAARAGVRRLVVTHVPPWHDPAEAVAQAKSAYDGPVEAAAAGRSYEI